MAFGAVHFDQTVIPPEKVLLLEHLSKDKTKEVRLGTKVKIKTHDGKKVKGNLTNLHEDAVMIEGEEVAFIDIERIKPYKKRTTLYWITWIISILLIVGLIALLGALGSIAFLFLLFFLLDPSSFTDELGTLIILTVSSLLLFIGMPVYSFKTRPKSYRTKKWRLRSVK